MAAEVYFQADKGGDASPLYEIPTGEFHVFSDYGDDSTRNALVVSCETDGLSVVRAYTARDFGANSPYESKARLLCDSQRIIAEVKNGQSTRVPISLHPEYSGQLLVTQMKA